MHDDVDIELAAGPVDAADGVDPRRQLVLALGPQRPAVGGRARPARLAPGRRDQQADMQAASLEMRHVAGQRHATHQRRHVAGAADRHLAEERDVARLRAVAGPGEGGDVLAGEQEDVLGQRHLHHIERGVAGAAGLDPQRARLGHEGGMAELGLDPPAVLRHRHACRARRNGRRAGAARRAGRRGRRGSTRVRVSAMLRISLA